MAADQGLKDFVNSLYEVHLGREADIGGLTSWSNALASGAMSQGAVANAIANSVENQIQTAYEQNLGRSNVGDTAASNWVRAVESGGMSMDEAIRNIAASQEARAYATRGATGGGGAVPGPGTKTPTTPGLTQADIDKLIQASNAKWQSQIDALTAQLGQQQRVNQTVQSAALQSQAMQNAAQGQFAPTTPAGAGLNLATITAAVPTTPAPTTATTAAQAVVPTTAMYVPQTYLAPAPPQYRNIDPFASPFTSPFQLPSPYAPQRSPFGMPYPSPFLSYADIAAAQVNRPSQGTPMVGPGGISPLPYYQGQSRQAAQAQIPTDTTQRT